MSRTVSAVTLGCKVNQYDTTAMLELLMAEGFEAVPWEAGADLYLVNTCIVTNTADKKSRNAIRRAKKANPRAVVVVCGCLAQESAGDILQEYGVDAVVGTQDRCRIAEVVSACFAGTEMNAVQQISKAGFENLSVHSSGEKTRGYVKIQEGCDSFCSYCIIPHVRGRVRSREAESAVAEAEALAANGVRELVLTGIHISSYGKDSGESLVKLIEGICQIDGILRVRLGSLEPHILTMDFLDAISDQPKVCPHFHVSLQSGSDTVLKRMNRKYNAGKYETFISNIRNVYDRPAITTDVITGFPGETEQEFLETMEFVKHNKFSRVHVFPYSERKGTVAATMEGSVPVHERKARARRLIAVAERLERQYAESFIGSIQNVLFEEAGCGYTDRYVRVCADGAQEGRLSDVLLKSVEDDIMLGEIADEGD